MATETKTADTKAAKAKRHALNTGVNAEFFSAFDSLSFAQKDRKLATTVRRAVEEYAAKHGPEYGIVFPEGGAELS